MRAETIVRVTYDANGIGKVARLQQRNRNDLP